ncbi:hypothetical protein [Paraburkholderia sp. J12]|uniref:hypothetical protein n=1 Tax=Paraburkholderia sp. J12 TaxID=2805432 RepID=UPI002ABDD854|nr:hypothetical protein [Paraburkholderia sp. J12]
MTEPTLRKPTKKAFYFPTTSVEAAGDPAPVKAGKAAKAAKSAKTMKAAKKVSKKVAKKVVIEAATPAESPALAPATTEASGDKPAAAAAEKSGQTVKKAEAVVAEVAEKARAKSSKKAGAKKDAVKKDSVKKETAKKEKVVRDSFTMPKADYEKIAVLKKKCFDAGVTVKKSELLRAGLLLLDSASGKRLLAAIAAVETVKTGRPAKSV